MLARIKHVTAPISRACSIGSALHRRSTAVPKGTRLYSPHEVNRTLPSSSHRPPFAPISGHVRRAVTLPFLPEFDHGVDRFFRYPLPPPLIYCFLFTFFDRGSRVRTLQLPRSNAQRSRESLRRKGRDGVLPPPRFFGRLFVSFLLPFLAADGATKRTVTAIPADGPSR